MPKNPIDFAYGDYEDAAPSVESRRVLNCYPETTPGKNTKTIVRGIEGFSNADSISGLYLGDIAYGINQRYLVVSNGITGGDLYEISTNGISTLIGNMALLGQGTNGSVKIAQNGKNIVIVSSGTNQTNDYYYDPNTATLDQIVNLDATYAGFPKATDVVVKDGYYLFSTSNVLFHGNNVSLGSGLTFNALSFQTVPADSDSVGGMEVANSQVYVFTRSKTFVYRVAPITPFSFQINTSFELDISATDRLYHAAVGNDIYVIGKTEGAQTVGFYRISGSSIELIRDQEFEAAITTPFRIVSYQLNSHKFIGIVNVSTVTVDDRASAFFYDRTESILRGYPIFHRRGFVLDTDNEQVENNYPILSYSTVFATGGTRQVFAYGYNNDTDTTTIYILLEKSSFNVATFFNAPVDNQRTFEYAFPVLRDNSNPMTIRAVSVGFNANVSNVELLQSTDGINYTSIGEFDLTSLTSKRSEWRRLGRYETDVSYKIRFDAIETTKPVAIIDGYYLT